MLDLGIDFDVSDHKPGLSYSTIIKERGIYKPVDLGVEDCRIIVFGPKCVMYLSADGEFEAANVSLWKNDKFIKTQERLKITLSDKK